MRWQLVADNGRGADGKRRQVFRAFRGSKRDAQIALRELLTEVDQGLGVVGRPKTFDEVANEWLQVKRGRNRTTDTIDGYALHLRDYLLPALGSKRIDTISYADIQELLDRLAFSGRKRRRKGEPEGLGVSALRGLRTVLRGVFKHAEKYRYIKYMPAHDLELPRAEPRNKQSLEIIEFHRLLAAAEGTRLYLPILLGGAMGLRKGEIYGLRWQAIDVEAARMRIVQQVSKRGEIRAPKGKKTRSVPIPIFVLSAIQTHKSRQNEERLLIGPTFNPDGYLFVGPHGTREKPSGINTLYDRLVRDAKIPRVTFHDLRHSAGSILLDAGVPLIVVSEILGHEDVATTARIYTHALNSRKREAADAMDTVLAGADDGAGGRPIA